MDTDRPEQDAEWWANHLRVGGGARESYERVGRGLGCTFIEVRSFSGAVLFRADI